MNKQQVAGDKKHPRCSISFTTGDTVTFSNHQHASTSSTCLERLGIHTWIAYNPQMSPNPRFVVSESGRWSCGARDEQGKIRAPEHPREAPTTIPAGWKWRQGRTARAERLRADGSPAVGPGETRIAKMSLRENMALNFESNFRST